MKAINKIKWTAKDVYNVFVLTFLIQLLIFVVLSVFRVGDYLIMLTPTPAAGTFLVFGIYLLQTVGMLFPLWFFAIRKYQVRLKDFGFKWIGSFKTMLWVLISYIFYIGLGIFVIVLFYNLGIGYLGFEPQQSIFDIFGPNTLGFMAALIVAVFIAPFVEEVYFRGFVLQTLAKVVSPFWGVVITALIFAAVHFQLKSIMPLLILSFILNILYLRTKSIWPGIIFHIFNNGLALTIMYIFENQHWL